MATDYKLKIIKNIRSRYLFALGLLSIFTIVTYSYFLYSKRKLEKDGYMINLSGRQRFLSKQIVSFALQYITTKKYDEKNELQNQLVQSLNEMETTHNLLAHDSVSISSQYHSSIVDAIYFKAPIFLDKKIDSFLQHAIVLGEVENDTITLENPHLKYLLLSSGNLVTELNRIVDQYQKEYEDEIKEDIYKISFLTLSALIAYFLIGILVFRPMKNKILNALIDLENTQIEMRQINEVHVVSIIDAQEKERQRIASGLHDGLVQLLTSIAYKFDINDNGLNEEYNNKFKEAKELINNAINETKNIAYSILPPLLKEFGLVPAINSLCEQMKLQGKFKVDFQTFSFTERLDRNIELALYRIVQEAFSNIIKHANAKNVMIQLIRHPYSIVVIIEDDGKGFDTTVGSASKGLGLINMQNRANAFNGSFVITSSSKMGSEIMVEIPI
jgi:signal transduction histidine kinase